jgi:hypothetical protein
MESRKRLWLGLGAVLLAEGLAAVGFWAWPKFFGSSEGEAETAAFLPFAAALEEKKPFEVSANYSTVEPTNQDVLVTIEAEREVKLADGWTRADGAAATTMTKVFSENAVETVQVLDLNGEAVELEVAVDNIDKTPPVVSNLWYSPREPTSDYVYVSFEASEEIVVSGWTYQNNAARYGRTFTANWSGTVLVRDLAGNTARVWVAVANIDKSLAQDSAQDDEVVPAD